MKRKKNRLFENDDEDKDYEIEDEEKSDIIVHEKYVKEKKVKK